MFSLPCSVAVSYELLSSEVCVVEVTDGTGCQKDNYQNAVAPEY